MYGYIHSTESFGSVDGPGVRFIIFTSGCPMRCRFCHNPDTWDMTAGEKIEADELLKKAMRYRAYWKNDGGITVSGGEPLMQIDFLLDLFKKAKEQGINTVIDTSGAPFTREKPFFEKFEELMKYTDRLLVDIKHIDPQKHIELTERKKRQYS
jgi:pyruvate formate lyase activating enzyme